MKTIKPRTAKKAKTSTQRPEGLERAPASLALKMILVPTDFSEASEKALRYAVRFGEQFGARITLVHVFEPIIYPAEMGYVPAEMQLDSDSLRENALKRVQELANKHLQPPLRGTALVRSGSPFNEIATVARELQADLIIIATHGYSGLTHLLLGSTAERVVRHAPCPVLVVREREHDFLQPQPKDRANEKQRDTTAHG